MSVGGPLFAYYPSYIPSQEVQDSILKALPSYPVTISELEGRMPVKFPRSSVQWALKLLIEQRLVVKDGRGPGTRYKRYRRDVYDHSPMGANRLFARRWGDGR